MAIYSAEVVKLQKFIEVNREVEHDLKAQGNSTAYIEAVKARKNAEAELEKIQLGTFLFNNSAFAALSQIRQ